MHLMCMPLRKDATMKKHDYLNAMHLFKKGGILWQQVRLHGNSSAH